MSPSEIDDRQIIAMLADDSRRAVELLFDRYYDELCRAAYRIVADAHIAEDLVQDTFLNLWKKSHRIKVEGSVRAYLRRAVVNRSLNYLRDRKPAFDRPAPLTGLDAGLSAPPAQKLSAEELQVEIDRAVDALPERCRLVFILSRFEDMSYQEIAEALSISPKTVENQIVKALAQLRQTLKPYLLTGLLAVLGLLP